MTCIAVMTNEVIVMCFVMDSASVMVVVMTSVVVIAMLLVMIIGMVIVMVIYMGETQETICLYHCFLLLVLLVIKQTSW